MAVTRFRMLDFGRSAVRFGTEIGSFSSVFTRNWSRDPGYPGMVYPVAFLSGTLRLLSESGHFVLHTQRYLAHKKTPPPRTLP